VPASPAPHILIIDDEEAMRDSCRRILDKVDVRVSTAPDGATGLRLLDEEPVDLLLLDLILPGESGLALLRQVRKNHPHLPVIIVSAYGTVKSAVEAMKLGAYDFLTKPFTPKELRRLVKQALQEALPAPAPGRAQAQIIYQSQAMAQVMDMVHRVARTDSTVLLTGESGTGKGLVARYIHELSLRADKPFISVDCGTLVETLFESELFGHVKGAFTGAGGDKVGKFEMAQGGTIFFDEISNINLEVQAKLLRAVEEREISRVGGHQTIHVDVRILAATNQELRQAIEQGRFREDLFYRLNVVSIHLPPLRDRREDIPLLIDFFIRMARERGRAQALGISAAALKRLSAHAWPGNVRELANAIERLAVLGGEGAIEAEDVSFIEQGTSNGQPKPGLSLDSVEREHIIKVLERFQGRRTEAAQALGIDRKTLREKIKRYGLED